MKRHLISAVALAVQLTAGAAFAAGTPEAARPATAPAAAASTPANRAVPAGLKAAFESRTQLKVDAIAPAQLGMWEVFANGQIYYTDAKADYLLEGALVDLVAKRNLTGERMAKLSSIDFASLPLQDAIRFTKGSGARTFVSFEDPNCGFCKRLGGELATLSDYTHYVFPISILGPDSAKKAGAVYCSRDRAGAWTAALAGADLSATPPCDAAGAVERNNTLAQRLKIRGTPTLFLATGERIPGYLPAAQLSDRLNAAAAPSK